MIDRGTVPRGQPRCTARKDYCLVPFRQAVPEGIEAQSAMPVVWPAGMVTVNSPTAAKCVRGVMLNASAVEAVSSPTIARDADTYPIGSPGPVQLALGWSGGLRSE